MGSANKFEGMVKREVLIAGVLIALVVGFLGGVIFSSFSAPVPPTAVPQGKSPQPSGAQQAQAGPSPELLAKIATLEGELKANPKNGGAWTQLGNLYFDSGQPAKAIDSYNRSLEINQGQADVWTDLGVMYRQNRQFKEALAAFDKAINLQPALEPAWFNKGIVLMHDLGDKEGGIKAWQQVVTINPNAQTPNGQLVKDLIVAASKQ